MAEEKTFCSFLVLMWQKYKNPLNVCKVFVVKFGLTVWRFHF